MDRPNMMITGQYPALPKVTQSSSHKTLEIFASAHDHNMYWHVSVARAIPLHLRHILHHVRTIVIRELSPSSNKAKQGSSQSLLAG